MSTVQLRRYEILPGQMDPFLEWWRPLVPVREQYGFRVLFAFADRENNEFVWAVSHDGDLEEADRQYVASPERERVTAGKPRHYGTTHVSTVEVALLADLTKPTTPTT